MASDELPSPEINKTLGGCNDLIALEPRSAPLSTNPDFKADNITWQSLAEAITLSSKSLVLLPARVIINDPGANFCPPVSNGACEQRTFIFFLYSSAKNFTSNTDRQGTTYA